MFVRWQLYKSQARNRHRRAHNDKHARLRAILVEGVRVDGKPRQKHIAFLGSIPIDGNERDREILWCRVTTALDHIGRLSPQERRKIATAVAQRVPGKLSTKQEIAAWERASAALLGSARSAT
jgi:hypothetical protein